MADKILYLIESLGAGGAEGALYSCLRFLDRSRFDGVVCPLYASRNHWQADIEGLGYKVVSPELRSRWDWERGVKGLYRLARNEGVSLIHTQLYDANQYGRLLGRKLRIPVLASLQSTDYEPEVWREDPGQSWAKLTAFRTLDRFTGNRWCTGWIAVSEFVRRSAIRNLHIPPSRIEVVFNSIDLEAFPESGESQRQEIRKSLGYGDRHLLLLLVARLHPAKGHKHLLSALPGIAAAHPDVQLLLAGTGAPGH